MNNHIVSGYVKRGENLFIIDPWAFPSTDEYESLVHSMLEDYDFALSKEGLIATPKYKPVQPTN